MPKTPLSFYLHIIAVAVLVFAVGNWLSSRTPERAEGSPSIISGDSSQASGLTRNDNRESVYERVLRTGTIRCGYHSWEPFLRKDINTGEFSGIYYDYMQGLGRILALKIEWVEDIGFGPHVEALKNDRFDMMCAGDFQNGARSRFIDYTTPILYTTLYAYVRVDDARFDTDLTRANNPEIKIASVEGTSPFVVVNHDFPAAQKITHPEAAELTTPLLDVATGKADLTIANVSVAGGFMTKNPGQLRLVPTPYPVRLFGSSLSLRKDEHELRRMIDAATREMVYSGAIAAIVKKYQTLPDEFLPVAKPYQSQEGQ